MRKEILAQEILAMEVVMVEMEIFNADEIFLMVADESLAQVVGLVVEHEICLERI